MGCVQLRCEDEVLMGTNVFVSCGDGRIGGGATVAGASVPEEDDMDGDRGAVHETVVGDRDGWCCMEPVMSGTEMGDKSSDGDEDL